jgi:flagellar hook assembly protein FlgD
VRLKVVDVRGKVVRVLTDEAWPAGRHSVVWTGENDAGDAAGPGVYFVRIEAGGFMATNKMLLMR